MESELVYDRLVARNVFETMPFLLTTYWLGRYYVMAGRTRDAVETIEATIPTMTDLELFCEQAVSSADLKGPTPAAIARCAFDLLFAHESPKSFAAFLKQLYVYYANRDPGGEKRPKARKPTKEEERLFRGNFPQVYSHEELVRLLVRLGV